jgi:hypothetical protein
VPGNRSIAQLAGRVEPMRSTPVVEGDDGVRVEPAPAPAPSSQSAAVLPKEIWRLVDFIYTRGIDMPGLFIAPGDEVSGSWPGAGPGSAVVSGVGAVIGWSSCLPGPVGGGVFSGGAVVWGWSVFSGGLLQQSEMAAIREYVDSGTEIDPETRLVQCAASIADCNALGVCAVLQCFGCWYAVCGAAAACYSTSC